MPARFLVICCLLAGTAIPALGDPLGAAWALRPSVMPEAATAVRSVLEGPWYFAPANPRNALLALHLVGLSLGFGSTLVLDAMLLRWLVRSRPAPDFAAAMRLLMRVVVIGLALLWISGLGFLVAYAIGNPAKLANPKLHAKISVVCALTLNGMLLHRYVLPLALADVTRPLLAGVTRRARLAALACGAVSAASWIFAFLLGMMSELNGRAGLVQILPCWLAAVFAILAGSAMILGGAERRLRKRERAAGDPAALGSS